MSVFNTSLWSPKKYAKVSVMAEEAQKEMYSRLQWMSLKPEVIADIGCGMAGGAIALQQYYPNAKVFALDLSLPMLEYAKMQDKQLHYVCAAAQNLPFADRTIDLIFANFLSPWCEQLPQLLSEWQRVLRSNGMLLFSALGSDTLKEWDHLFAINDIPIRMDMHDVGDALIQAGFADPVIDVDHYTLVYRDKNRLLDELINSGMWFPTQAVFDNTTTHFPEQDIWQVTYEVVYAHAFKPAFSQEATADEQGIARIPLSKLRRQLESKGI